MSQGGPWIESLLVEALRCGMTVSQFWDLTPRETLHAIEAEVWRLERVQRGRLWLAWHVAAFARAKKLPSLQRLLAPADAKPLEGEALDTRREEFAQMTANYKQAVTRGG